jgi:4-diphosphocytidyl-2-C-methyl-D-erythritol kinase
MPTAVRSHAKVNLGLYIGAARPDGFHGLSTVYQTLELNDIVTVCAHPAETTSIRLTANDSRVPTDSRNTAWKTVELALQTLRQNAAVDIHIEKRLPIQGGLGAGSANAVAALVGLENELGIAAFPGPKTGTRGMQPDEGWNAMREGGNWNTRRLEIAAQVGSDVPLFLIGGAVLGTDRGQLVEPLPDIEPTWSVIATPAVGVSTPQAFRDWDELCRQESLTQQASQAKLNELSRAYVRAFQQAIPAKESIAEGWQGAGSSGVLSARKNLAGLKESALVRTGILTWIRNDFERVVFAQHPSLAEIKRILLGSGTPEAALHASLSGSGSALFGLYQTRGDAEAARQRLRADGVASHLTRTLSRPRYWSEMVVQQQD